VSQAIVATVTFDKTIWSNYWRDKPHSGPAFFR